MQLSVKRDDESAAFFDAAAEGTLLALRCGNCGKWVSLYLVYGTVSRVCRNCRSGRLEWQATSGTGTLITWTLIPGVPPVVEGAPVQASGIVELTEGPWLTCALDVPVSDLAVGLPCAWASPDPGAANRSPSFVRTDHLP